MLNSLLVIKTDEQSENRKLILTYLITFKKYLGSNTIKHERN